MPSDYQRRVRAGRLIRLDAIELTWLNNVVTRDDQKNVRNVRRVRTCGSDAIRRNRKVIYDCNVRIVTSS